MAFIVSVRGYHVFIYCPVEATLQNGIVYRTVQFCEIGLDQHFNVRSADHFRSLRSFRLHAIVEFVYWGWGRVYINFSFLFFVSPKIPPNGGGIAILCSILCALSHIARCSGNCVVIVVRGSACCRKAYNLWVTEKMIPTIYFATHQPAASLD